MVEENISQEFKLENIDKRRTIFISISAFVSLLDIPIVITSSGIGSKIFELAAGINLLWFYHFKIVN